MQRTATVSKQYFAVVLFITLYGVVTKTCRLWIEHQSVSILVKVLCGAVCFLSFINLMYLQESKIKKRSHHFHFEILL